MAVFTPVSESAAKAFLADYDIGALEARILDLGYTPLDER